mmetsp:Transcript_38287/g.94987  ORF Transcript_38287/g.94987 Transcript_38287/m.94987 type:complete len:968 (-) Transcript_38287:275-3178(-)|eukprot:CAMPEP_0197578286 /NCGR_PEP_ID=MMETSP1326-20131121/2567_1 /TAXON_ID=1155430 /ORGANISM="Genus nov. species nov., Strain RCC2288" /LENGTH=967 /DNA_ID=CAMNT_0043141455 /DNA_START=280 /DNA_END=3183 /DNA_ORIENTATION=-
MPAVCTAAELLTLVAKLKIEDSYAKAAEALATLTEDKNDEAIRRRVADADATPKLCKVLEAFVEGIKLHADALREKEAKEARYDQARTFLKNATDAFDDAEEKKAKAGDFTEADEEAEKKKGGSSSYNPLELAKEKKEEYFKAQRQKEFDSAQEAKTEAERLEKKALKERDNSIEHEEAMLNRRIYLEMAAASTLQVLINISRSKPNRLLIDQCGCVAPACRMLDMSLKREVFERSVMLLINCSTGPELLPVHQHILEAGGVPRLVEMLKLGPGQATAHRAIQVLSLISLNDGVKDAFRDTEGAFEALAAMLGAEQDGLYVKHAALCGNHLCEMNVPNKLAFMEHGCIPPMMALIKRGPTSPLTDIVVHTITSLAVGNELCDPVITNSGPLPYLVDLIANDLNPKLTLPAVTAVMHMAREDADAKQILSIAGVIPKLKALVNKDTLEEKQAAKVTEKAISGLSNLANNSVACQSALAQEGVLEVIKGMMEVVPPNTKMAQVCLAFAANFALKNPDTALAVKEADMLPLIAYHHLNGRALGTKESRAALIALGSVVNEIQESADFVGGMFSQILLHECLEGAPDGSISIPEGLKDEMTMFRKELGAELEKMRAKFRGKSSKMGLELDSAAANMMARVTGRKSIKTEVKEMEKAKRLAAQLAEAQALEEMTLLAGASINAGDFAPLARKAHDARKARVAKAARDAAMAVKAEEEAVEREEAEEHAAKEKEVLEAEEAREELRKAQADAAKSKAAALKEVSEAKAAKKDWEAAQKAVAAKRDHFERERLKAEKSIRDTRAKYTMESAALRKEVAALETALVGATPEAKDAIEAKWAASKDAALAVERKLLPDGDDDIKMYELQAAEFEAAKGGEIVASLEAVVAEKKAIYEKEQREADQAESVKTAALDQEQVAKLSAKKEIKEARVAELQASRSVKRITEKKARLAAGLSADSMLSERDKAQSACCVVM